jgi:hypothetical protein
VLDRAAESPSTRLVAQIRDGFGDEKLDHFAIGLATGLSTRDAADLADLPSEWVLDQLAAHPYASDIGVTTDRARGVGIVHRLAPVDAPPEPVRVVVDGDAHVIWLGPGSAAVELPGKRFRADPEAHVADPDRNDLTAPPRYRLLATGWVATINLADLWMEAEGQLLLRKSGATHGGPSGQIYSNRTDLVGADLAWSYGFGHLVDGMSRAGRIRGSIGGALLDPRFSGDERVQVALDAGITARWDDRQAWDFPLSGRFGGVSLEGGFVPARGTAHGAARGWVGGVVSPDDVRHAFAFELLGGVAHADVDQRRLSLGGSGGLLSIDPTLILGDALVVGRAEWRWAPTRDLSVPLFLLWLSEVHLSGGAEAGVLWTADQPVRAIGATGGVGVDADWLGMVPGYLGVSAGVPVWADGVDLPKERTPEFTVRGQALF